MLRRRFLVGSTALLSGCSGQIRGSDDESRCPDDANRTVVCYAGQSPGDETAYLAPSKDEIDGGFEDFEVGLVNTSDRVLNANVCTLEVYRDAGMGWQRLDSGGSLWGARLLRPNSQHVWSVSFDELADTRSRCDSVTIGDLSAPAYTFAVEGEFEDRNEGLLFACAVDVNAYSMGSGTISDLLP